MVKMLGNKYSDYSKLEQGTSKSGIEIAVEDSTAVKTLDSNKTKTDSGKQQGTSTKVADTTKKSISKF